MMDKLSNLLGKNLYKKVMIKLDGKELYLNDGKLIPKYRLDEVSKALKEQRLKCANLRAIMEAQASEYIKVIENLKINLIIFKLIAKSKPKDFDAVLKFIKKENLTPSNAEKSMKYQIKKIKSNFPQLFYTKQKT